MAEWKDVTSYSKGDTERVPTAWEVSEGNLRVCVTKGHRMRPGEWVMHCRALNMDTVSTGLDDGADAAVAQARALKLVARKLASLTADLERIA